MIIHLSKMFHRFLFEGFPNPNYKIHITWELQSLEVESWIAKWKIQIDQKLQLIFYLVSLYNRMNER